MIFDEDTPAEIIRRVQPDVLVKGADWPADQIVGRDTVEARGGRVVRVPVEQGLFDDGDRRAGAPSGALTASAFSLSAFSCQLSAVS